MSDGYEREIRQYKDFPYCVIGGPHIPQSTGFFLRVDPQGSTLIGIHKRIKKISYMGENVIIKW